MVSAPIDERRPAVVATRSRLLPRQPLGVGTGVSPGGYVSSMSAGRLVRDPTSVEQFAPTRRLRSEDHARTALIARARGSPARR